MRCHSVVASVRRRCRTEQRLLLERAADQHQPDGQAGGEAEGTLIAGNPVRLAGDVFRERLSGSLSRSASAIVGAGTGTVGAVSRSTCPGRRR